MFKSSYWVHFIALLLFCIVQNRSYAQKPPLDPKDYDQWVSLSSSPIISDNGKYAMFKIGNKPIGSETLVVTSTDVKWKMEFTNKNNFKFLNNNLGLFSGSDSTFFIHLGGKKIEYIPNFKGTISDSSDNLWVVLNTSGPGFLFKNWQTGRVLRIDSIDYIKHDALVKSGETIVVEGRKKDKTHVLFTINLLTGNKKIIWKGSEIVSQTVDRINSQFAFLSKSEQNDKQLWSYKLGDTLAIKIGDGQIEGGFSNLLIDRIHSFSQDGARLFVYFKEQPSKNVSKIGTALNIWHYNDKDALPYQIQYRSTQNFAGVVDMRTYKAICLQKENDVGFIDFPISNDGHWAFLGNYYNGPGSKGIVERFLINTVYGTRSEIDYDGVISPNGKFYIYFDESRKNFFSRNLKTGNELNLTEYIDTKWIENEPGYGGITYGQRGRVVGWLKNESGVFLCDEFDIWLVDLTGINSPKNVTNGYGRKNSILFSLRNEYLKYPIVNGEELILTAFNSKTKENGFYKIVFGKYKNPAKLTMGSYSYYLKEVGWVSNESKFEPLKSQDAHVYVVKRGSAIESYNYFATKDFKSFTRLSNLNPEKNFNWYSTSLHEWVTPDSIQSQGILYKPEDFDPSKKYPVIFHYYASSSANLNAYITPQLSDGDLPIPWYVSNGYLVFQVDIHHSNQGKIFEQSLNTLTSAVKYLIQLPYVDSTKMAIQGHSWGGILTSYFVTHTNLFKAACSAASLSNFVSQYNSLMGLNFSHSFFDSANAKYGNGKTLWEDPVWFFKNSPVMSAPNVQTPLLMFETTKDEACPFANAFELYGALRKLGKKVWMLEYLNANHGVDGIEAEDFDLRMRQFFGYYLKDAPPPKWMTQGRPPNLRRVDDRLDFDLSGTKP